MGVMYEQISTRVQVCDVHLLCVCGCVPAPEYVLTYPRSFLLEKEKENLESLLPDSGHFSSFCSSSIFSRESGLLF